MLYAHSVLQDKCIRFFITGALCYSVELKTRLTVTKKNGEWNINSVLVEARRREWRDSTVGGNYNQTGSDYETREMENDKFIHGSWSMCQLKEVLLDLIRSERMLVFSFFFPFIPIPTLCLFLTELLSVSSSWYLISLSLSLCH